MDVGFGIASLLFAGLNIIFVLVAFLFNIVAAIWVFFNCRSRLGSNLAGFIWACIVLIAPTLIGLIVYLLWRNRESFHRIFGQL